MSTTVAFRRLRPSIGAMLATWLLLAVVAGAAGWVERYPLPLPSLVLGLTLALLAVVWRSPSIRDELWRIGPAPIVALHLTRFVGVVFLVLGARGLLPADWAAATGWGDITVAVAAVPLLLFAAPFRSPGQRRALFLWNVLGLADILLVVAGAVRLVLTDPTGAQVMERFPMSLLPTFLVPVVLVSHVLIFVWLHRSRGAVGG